MTLEQMWAKCGQASPSHIDPANDGSEVVSDLADRIRAEFLTWIDLADL
ncbi:hypothetical protein AB4Z18_13885 [Leifsonia sp. 2TAF2]